MALEKWSAQTTKLTFHDQDLLLLSNTDDAGITFNKSQKINLNLFSNEIIRRLGTGQDKKIAIWSGTDTQDFDEFFEFDTATNVLKIADPGGSISNPDSGTINIMESPDGNSISIGCELGGGHQVHTIKVMEPNTTFNAANGGDLFIEAGNVSSNSANDQDGGFLYLKSGKPSKQGGTDGESNIIFQTADASDDPNGRALVWGTRMTIKKTGFIHVNEKMGIAIEPTGLAQLEIDQLNTDGEIPVIELDQADLSEEFINFKAIIGAGNPIDTAALGAFYGTARVAVNGTFKKIALYDI